MMDFFGEVAKAMRRLGLVDDSMSHDDLRTELEVLWFSEAGR